MLLSRFPAYSPDDVPAGAPAGAEAGGGAAPVASDTSVSSAPEVPAPTADAEAPATSTPAPIPPVQVVVPTVDAAAEGVSAEAAAAWNGEVDSVTSQSWYTELPPAAQQKVLDGLRAKYLNLERGVQSKFQALSQRAKDVDAKAAKLHEDNQRFLRMMHGGADPVEELQAELVAIKERHQGAIDALKAELERNATEQLTARDTELAALREERDALKTRVEAIEAAELAAQEAAEAEAAEAVGREMEEQIPGITEDPSLEEAFVTFVSLLKMGRSMAAAARATKAAHPELAEREAAAAEQAQAEVAQAAKETPEEVPAALDMMSMDGGAHGNALRINNARRSAEDVMADLRKGAGGFLG